MKPRSARSAPSAATCRPERIVAMPRDNWHAGDYWLLCDGVEVTLAAQKVGQPPTGSVTIPRRQFNSLIRGYQKPAR